jgi:hypothetical protein
VIKHIFFCDFLVLYYELNLIRNAIVEEMAALGAVVHTCTRSQASLMHASVNGRRRVLKLVDQSAMYPLKLTEGS